MSETATVVAGVGMHPFGRFEDLSALDLGAFAVREALEEADMSFADVDAMFVGHMYAKTGAGHRLLAHLGRTGIPVINVENACSSGAAALQMAHQALSAGQFETVLAVGLEKMPRGAMRMDYFEPWQAEIGHALNPVQFALAAQRHMHEYGTTEEQLARVAVKNHRNSVHNDRAMYRQEIPMEAILTSRQVVDPLRLLMLCTPNEGGAAALATRRVPRPGDVTLIGQGLATATLDQSIGEHMPTFSPVADPPHDHVMRRAAKLAYAMAGIGPEDVDVAELQDTDAFTEILATEQVGLCGDGEGGEFVASGVTEMGGKIPVNPSGGLLSKGEPVGASGLGQVYEVVRQLKGRCGPRQVDGARTGLTMALGAGGNCSAMIFQGG